jgi:hypothetical protein
MESNEDVRICSFDIKNIYTNIPKSEVIDLIENPLEIIKTSLKEIINSLKTEME